MTAAAPPQHDGHRRIVHLLDYGAGNVRSVVNAVQQCGWTVRVVETAEELANAERLIFPGVGAFGSAVQALHARGFWEPLRAYLDSGRPFMGVCVGMQVLFAASEESPGVAGLGVFPASVRKFDDRDKSVPHMGWNGATMVVDVSDGVSADDAERAAHHGAAVHGVTANAAADAPLINHRGEDTRYYFVHSYAVTVDDNNEQSATTADWSFAYALTCYGKERFVSAVRRGNIFATQFHPEKSGTDGLAVIRAFLESSTVHKTNAGSRTTPRTSLPVVKDRLAKRIIACLDVRANDAGDLVVTKGDQYDVHERSGDGTAADVRNLGKPVDLARRYYEEGADEVTFLNITSFRNCPLGDLPMLEVLRRTSEMVFVPLTIGGGIRGMRDEETGKETSSAVDVADAYFRSGADKVSIGSDAVYAAEEYYRRLAAGEQPLQGDTAIEQIAQKYGRQAVVISVDPKRVDVSSASDTPHHVIDTTCTAGPNAPPRLSWYQCTVKGGREPRDIDVHQLVRACEALGAGEILLNSMDRDGTNAGFDHALIRDVRAAVRIPVVASSGAGRVEHFAEVFEGTGVESALAAGIFHRREVPIAAVKQHLLERGIPARAVTLE